MSVIPIPVEVGEDRRLVIEVPPDVPVGPADVLILSTLFFDTSTLAKAHPLRALNAIQLASALRAGAILAEPITFLSSDRTLLAAATAEGLLTDDPLLHP